MPPGAMPGPMPERQPIPGVKNLIAVASGKGGVGKTTVAVNLSLALAKLGHKVGLLDADVYGPNVPIMLGTNAEPMATMQQRIIPVEAKGVKMISMGLLNPGDKPVIWRGPMLHSVITQFLRSVEWGQLDYLVIDLPPGTGDGRADVGRDRNRSADTNGWRHRAAGRHVRRIRACGAEPLSDDERSGGAIGRNRADLRRAFHTDRLTLHACCVLSDFRNASIFACRQFRQRHPSGSAGMGMRGKSAHQQPASCRHSIKAPHFAQSFSTL